MSLNVQRSHDIITTRESVIADLYEALWNMDRADAEFLEGLCRGDEPHTARLFQEYRHRLIALARQRLVSSTRQKVDAEEVV